LCGICRITDLGILHFYFSSKNYGSKAYTPQEKVVVLVILSKAKIGLDIFGFFYDFISILQVSAEKHKRIRIYLLKTPWTFWNLTVLPLLSR
jgi:hypothetical protein